MKRRLFLMTGVSTLTLAACQIIDDPTFGQEASDLPTIPGVSFFPKVSNALSSAGINLTGDWHGNRAGRYPGNLDSEIETTLSDGFKHVTFITRCDDFFDFNCTDSANCINYRAVDRRINPILQQIRRFSARYPDRVFVISLKGYEQVGGWDAPGIKQSFFARALERNLVMQDAFVECWQYIARLALDIPSSTLVFCLMNEPEWHTYPGGIASGRDAWLELATRAIDSIRTETSDRAIILEAVDKGTWYRVEGGPNRIIRKIRRDGIIYGFHYYGPHPESWTHQIDTSNILFSQNLKGQVVNEIRSLLRWKRAQSVPVILSEMGAWGPYFESGELVSGASATDRAEWAGTVVNMTFPDNVGITWWALNEHNTPYQRLSYDEPKIQPRLVRDDLLWRALQLTPN